jgi:hypothetical protein
LESRIEDYNTTLNANRVITALKDKNYRDLRFRGQAAQMQDIYLAIFQTMGIRLKKEDLINLWKAHCESEHQVRALEEKHRKLLNLKYNVEKRIKAAACELRKAKERYEKDTSQFL